ncbi:MAG TPA: class I SAM-dependent methyltransferase [Ktedonobacterales bacterium]|nr:class I SAM-dependent methyltransferase [Ktedonobacterales bacterium]
MTTTQMDATGVPGPRVNYPWFSRFFNWLAARGPGREAFAELRRATAGRASGVTLELGAGGGSNFAFYDPALVERVEATEPDATMLRFARERATEAHVPVTLTQAPAEALPFADGVFDTAVMTLVFCSVADPDRSLRELLRVLKPGGRLLMAEHVRSEHQAYAAMQTALVPLTARVAANCHWNRDTAAVVRQSGFTDVRAQPVIYPSAGIRMLAGGLLPILLIDARKPE